MDSSLPVAAIVLNWNSYEDTRACVESLQKLNPGVRRIIVVDNGSTDESGERIKDEFTDVEVLSTGENVGFAGGMTVGIDEAVDDDVEYLWLLNNDVIFPEESTLLRLCSVLDKESDVAGVSPLIREYPETDNIWFWRGFIDWGRGYAAHEPPERFNAEETDDHVSNDYVTCCAFLVRTEVIEEHGGLPTDYFLYHEDVDLGAQLGDEGHRLLTVTDAVAHHRVSASSGDDTGPIPAYYLARNRILFARKFDDRIGHAFYVWYALGVLNRLKWYLMCREWKSIVALLHGVVDGIRGRTGKGPYP